MVTVLMSRVELTDLACVFQGFVKVVKNKAYFKRYQVKFRRRRGKLMRFLVNL